MCVCVCVCIVCMCVYVYVYVCVYIHMSVCPSRSKNSDATFKRAKHAVSFQIKYIIQKNLATSRPKYSVPLCTGGARTYVHTQSRR